MTVLFNSIDVARAIVQHLRGDWDGFNAVLFKDEIDLAALRLAIALVKLELKLEEKIEYCSENEYCQILFSQKQTSTEINDKTVELENFNIALGRKLGCQFVIGSQDITALFNKGE